jgi:hypothetical protein
MECPDSNKDRLHQQLIKLGDMMGAGMHHEEPWIEREYRRVAKQLYPEMFPRKKRKPSQQFIRTLKECDCGQKGWTFTRYATGSVGLKCKSCGKDTGECKPYTTEVRDKWNALNS